MAIDEKIARINELAKKAKTVGLSDEEMAERDVLRAEYIKGFRDNLTQTLEHTYIMDENGNKKPLNKNNN